jgi:hypothetical protein
MRTFTRLSQQIDDIAHGRYYSDKALNKAIKCKVLNEIDRTILMLKSQGVTGNDMFHELQLISIKLYVNRY